MLSENHKISSRQMKRILIFDMISISILIVPGIADHGAGRDGLLSIFLATLSALLYGGFFYFISKKTTGDFLQFSQQTTGRILTSFFTFFYLIKVIFSCWFTLSLFIKVINDTLLPNTNLKLILLSLILVSIYAASKGIEVRARMAEILFLLVLVPLLLYFCFAFFKLNITNLFPLFMSTKQQVSSTSYSVFLTYSALELLLFILPVTVSEDGEKRKIRDFVQAILLTGLINIVLFILVIGILGSTGSSQLLKSSMTIIQIMSLPGRFLQRQDAVILSIWMFSIFTITSTYFFYCVKFTNQILPRKKPSHYFIFYGILFFALVSSPVSLEQLFHYYGRYMAWIGFPLSILIPLLVVLASKITNAHRLLRSALLICLCVGITLTTSGCSDLVEVQNRDFVMALGVSLNENQFQLTYALPDLSQVTDKSSQQDHILLRSYQSQSLPEIEDRYNLDSDKRLDYRHLEVLILDQQISDSPDYMAGLLDYLDQNFEISRDVLVFYYPGNIQELLNDDKDVNGSIGDYLKKLEENNQKKYGITPATIGDLTDSYNLNKPVMIPVIELHHQMPVLNGGAVFQSALYVNSLSNEDLALFAVLSGRNTEYSFQTENGIPFRILHAKRKLSYSYDFSQPKILYTIKGTAKLLTQREENTDQIQDLIQSYLETAMASQINHLLKDDNTDYLNLYDKSSIHCPDMWISYKNHPIPFAEDIIVELNLDISIN